MRSTVTLRPSDSSLLTSLCLTVSGVEAIEVVSPKIPIFDGCLQNVEGNDEEGVGGGNGGPFYATAGGHSPELFLGRGGSKSRRPRFI